MFLVIQGNSSSGPHAPPPPFAADSVWNAPLSADAPVSPRSSTYVAELRQQVAQYGTWINTTEYSIPVYTVGSGQSRVPVTLDTSGPGSADELAAAFRQGVPIPARARASRGTDEEMVIWQPSTNTLWEFWLAHQVDGRWHARWGGKMTDVSASPGYYVHPPDWGGSATSLSLLGGLMLAREVRAGSIDHALALAIPHAQAGHYVLPAQRTDGNEQSSTAIPEGTRFRLDPHLDIASLHLPRLTAMMARAAQRYGILIRDQSGSVSFYGQDPASTATDPWDGRRGAFQETAPNTLLKGFPWNALQVVAPPAPGGG